MYKWCGGIFNIHLTAHLLRNLPVKSFLIGKNLTELLSWVCGPSFLAHPVPRSAVADVARQSTVHQTVDYQLRVMCVKPCSQQTNWTELNCSSRTATAALLPINFVTLTRVTNNASCYWVNLMQVNSVQYSSCGVNSSIGKHVFRTPVCELQFIVQFSSVCLLWTPL